MQSTQAPSAPRPPPPVLDLPDISDVLQTSSAPPRLQRRESQLAGLLSLRQASHSPPGPRLLRRCNSCAIKGRAAQLQRMCKHNLLVQTLQVTVLPVAA